MAYLNPNGFDFGSKNFDGYGISQLAFAVVYTVVLYGACIYLWMIRHHPIVKMRRVGLMTMAVLVLHVYLFLVFTAYFLNGTWPCSVVFWIMSVYLPTGIGLFQVANQQLLVVSRQQTHLITVDVTYKPLPPTRGPGVGDRRYWLWRFKMWYRWLSTEGTFEGFVVIGILLQIIGTLIIFILSRKFSRIGIVSYHTSPALCLRGWEWIPSAIWQCLWSYVFGPYLLWKIRMVRDIYHWRLQTTIAVVAGLPGTPMWLISVSVDAFAPVNKYWLPAMWFIPGMMAMEIVTVAFPIYQYLKHNRAARATNRILTVFDRKKQRKRLNKKSSSSNMNNDFATAITSKATSPTSLSLTSTKRNQVGKMYSMESLDVYLAGDDNALQIYASCVELNGENIIFLKRALSFKTKASALFASVANSGIKLRNARMEMFKQALEIFITLVHVRTATYPINIESPVYQRLESVFGAATGRVAVPPATPVSGVSGGGSEDGGKSKGTMTPASMGISGSGGGGGGSKDVTPWDFIDDDGVSQPSSDAASSGGFVNNNNGNNSFPMRALASKTKTKSKMQQVFPSSLFASSTNNDYVNDSSEHILPAVPAVPNIFNGNKGYTVTTCTGGAAIAGVGAVGAYDILDGIPISPNFNENVFDAAFSSIRYMVWSETWQRFMGREKAVGGGA